MAESSAKKLAAQREELESKGSKAVEALFEANESVVDLDAAERIGLISAETRAKIEANFGLGEAREIFGRILNKEKERGKTDPEAFKRAFEAMYGKFVLEERDVADVESPDGSLITVLRKVLKFPVEEKDGQLTIAGRPELQAAAKRLRMLQAESGAELEIGDLMIANRQEQGDANNAVERLKKELDALEYAAEKGKEIKPAGLKDLRIDLELKYGKTQKTREALDSLNGPKNKQLREEVDRLALIEAFFSDAANKLADQLDGLATELEAKGAKDEAKGIRDVAEKIKNLMRTRPLDVETWKNFLKNDLSVQVSFLTSRKCRKILGASDKQDELKKSFGFVKENLDGVGKFNTAKGQLNAAGKKISDLEAEQIRSENDEFEVKMEVLYTLGEFDRDVQEYLLDKVPNEINERIKAYLENFSKNIVYDSANVSAENVLGFLKNDYQVFVAYLDEALTTAVREKNHERNDAEDKLSKLAEKGKRIGGFKAGSATVENILKDAFAGVDPLKILELEREHTEVQAKEEALTEHYKYFSGKESAGIHGKFLAIEDSVVTSGEVRKKEADFKKAEADKTRLDQLKDTFSEAKVSSLLDLFREFDALKDSYLPMEDRKNLDATITAKSSSISIMEKELEAEFTAKKKQKSGEEIGQDSSNYQQRIEQLRKNLEKDIEALEKLKKQKADWDKFKELAKKLRTELQRYCREYLASFELIPDDQHKKIIEQKKRTLDAMNVESGFNPEELKNAYQLLEPGFSKSFGAVKAKLEDTEITLKEKQNFEDAKSKLEKAKVLYADLKPIMDRIKAVKSLGVDIEHVDTMVEDFKKIKIDDINFSAKDLTEFYSKYFSLLLGDTNGKKHLLEMFEKRIAE
ncbi:hypothetical protein HYW82_03040, partial [Candidatus Peregrinibacteria bacterium]|nr:hypothetical protein [Candidatus Peregrinibacteria bacterium]